MRRTFTGIHRSFELDRVPVEPKDQLFAFDAADELLIRELSERDWLCQKPWILGDRFGALTLALADWSPCLHSDSALSYLGLEHNARLNGIDVSQIELHPPPHFPEQSTQLVVMRIPKATALLESQLIMMRPYLNSETRIVAGAMTKYLRTSTIECFERILGETFTTKAVKKARLIISRIDEKPSIPITHPSYELPDDSLSIMAHPGVFSAGRLDIGTRFFLQNLPTADEVTHMVDLGCGDGVLGVVMGHRHHRLSIHFTDVSNWAIESARTNWAKAGLDPDRAHFSVSDALSDMAPDSTDLVLCNPPFHDGHATGDHIAWRMFKQARRVLKSGGELRIVGNRHLAYHTKLKRLFGGCQTIASNAKFVVLSAVKQ